VSDFTLSKISEHVYWMAPGAPDRPSLCAVVGSDHVLMLDAGASAAHTQLFLDALRDQGIAAPRYVVLTHWHWDHVFGAKTVGAPIIATGATTEQLMVLAGYDWGDAALDQRVTTSEEIAFCADNIKLELPAPRQIEIAIPDIVFHETLDIRLGGVTCHLRHVGGDHAADSCIAYIEPDRIMFLGDCLYDAIYTPVRHYTAARLFPLLDTVLGYDAQTFIEGHNGNLMSRVDVEAMAAKMRIAGELVKRFGVDAQTVLAQGNYDDDTVEFIQAFIAGKINRG
jgi:glyoxylase-like metal-dependent hydrolase (beta-lactamase superfamily II)